MQKINKTDALVTILGNRRFTVDYFQREYRWGRKQIEQMLSDFQNAFEEYYDPDDHDTPEEVAEYGFYYMGCIICTGGSVCKIIDGQQRLTSLTLLLIYLMNLQKKLGVPSDEIVDLNNMIYAVHFGKKSFNLDVDERKSCMQALLDSDDTYVPDSESTRTMKERYDDIQDLFPDELQEEALPFFIYWLKEKVLLLEIDTPTEDEAHTIFLTMNDRGLSLNSAEMMKAYIIQQVSEADRIAVNQQWQTNVNRIKNASNADTSGMVNTEDVEFISTWLRAKYAMTLRGGKRGAKDEDYELLGDKFHSWVRSNSREKMNLVKSKDYKSFVMTEMTSVTNVFLQMKEYSNTLTTGYEEVFYNADRDFTYQTMLVLAAVKSDDSAEIIEKKIQMTAKFVDDFGSVRILNFKKANWNSNKYMLFKLMCDIRNQDCKTIGMVYVRALRKMDVSIDGMAKFSLNQFSSRYMLHFLARFTSYANVLMGNPSNFADYVDRKKKGNTYDIEHIIPNNYDDYKDDFEDYDAFQAARQSIGNLILLTRDKNRSYQAMRYQEKVKKYAGDNILAKALNPIAYTNNPQFIANVVSRYDFKAIDHFDEQSIVDRTAVYMQMACDIWNPIDIKLLSGGWTIEEEKAFFKSVNGRDFTVGYTDKSWEDAVKYGFLSASLIGSGRSLYNVQPGDIVYCYVAGRGYVGIGECVESAVKMSEFTVDVNGIETPISDVQWIDAEAKANLDVNKEIFLKVKWKKTVSGSGKGYWEKGLVTVPLVTYSLTDKSTYLKVKEYFNYTE